MTTLTLSVLAGAFIAFGAVVATVAATGTADFLPFGVIRVLMGIVFSVGLILVVVGGAELFTGNNLIVMAWASGRISTASLLRNWGLVFAGNFVGAMGIAVLVVASGHLSMGDGAVAKTAFAIAEGKLNHSFLHAVLFGRSGQRAGLSGGLDELQCPIHRRSCYRGRPADRNVCRCGIRT